MHPYFDIRSCSESLGLLFHKTLHHPLFSKHGKQIEIRPKIIIKKNDYVDIVLDIFLMSFQK
jgi:hypothetical protein